MKISIDGNYVIVEVDNRIISFDCTKETKSILQGISNCVDDKHFDKYDGERILKFVLQTKRMISMGGKH